MVIDFKEISQANAGDGYQDTFELFSRDFLEDLGFKILSHPDRGADGKKDMIIEETRSGIAGETKVKWLVSCKHYVHSGKSVSDTDEPDIIDRVRSHGCDGFLGVYSTLAATSLSRKLQGYKGQFESDVYDRERIEKKLLTNPEGIHLARRYFPVSVAKHLLENPKPASIFKQTPEIKCGNCHKNLLETGNGIFACMYENKEKPIDKSGHPYYPTDLVYFSCKGNCDEKQERAFRSQGYMSNGWEDIDDLKVPTLYLRNLMAYVNELHNKKVTDEAHEKMKSMYINLFPHVSRELSSTEKDRIQTLSEFGLM